MRTFDNYLEACEFSKENLDTLVKLVGQYANGSASRICHFFNGNLHGVYIQLNDDGSVRYIQYYIKRSVIVISDLSELQLQNIFGECYENI